ncbi:haloacid dehalogenase-like hydrolase [Adlercreutzia sp. ZJ154]|uniref:haloacid dehalogenase-like hydrolase n=1 Tax=Adlercreutzia sp. ZJ154 TaxID=2709790 RepID=UPI0013ECCA04|nr:haloacid dehalogenase-like hydrolase [Adlercreutzia sp. ZJ154]
MQVFDFDGTIYDGDSTVDFYKFALRKCPACAFALPTQAAAATLYITKRISLDQFKGRFYTFLQRIDNTDALVAQFWDSHWHKIKKEVASLIKPGDMVASASPEFLLRPACKRLGVGLIASKVDSNTGKLLGPNCRDKQKAQRLREAGLEGKIEVFYTDSSADEACIAMSDRGVLVCGRKLSDYSLSSS